MIYSVSYCTSAEDSGACVSFEEYDAARREFNALVADGVASAILWQGAFRVISRSGPNGAKHYPKECPVSCCSCVKDKDAVAERHAFGATA